MSALVFRAQRDETQVTLAEAARRMDVCVATLSRRCVTDKRWKAAAVLGATGRRVRWISVPRAIELGIAVYEQVSPTDTARAVLKAVQEDAALRRDLVVALMGVAP